MTRKRKRPQKKKRKDKKPNPVRDEFKKLANLTGWEEPSSSSQTSSSESSESDLENQDGADHSWLFKDFDHERSQAALRGPPPLCQAPILAAGNQRASLADLQNVSAEDYVQFSMNRTGSVSANVRLTRRVDMEDMPATSLTYTIQIQQQDAEPLQFANFNDRLYNLLLSIFNSLVERFAHLPNAAVQLSLRHRLATDAFTSELRPLTAENGPYSIVDVLEQIHSWTQSEGKDAIVDTLDLECFVIDNSLHGQGVPLIGVGDANFQRKRMSRQNPMGSVLYVPTKKNCFFIAAYFGILHIQLQANAAIQATEKDLSVNHTKYLHEMNEAFYQKIETSNDDFVQKETRDFFRQHNIDIEDYSEDDTFLEVLYRTFSIQTSVFEPVQGFKRKIIVPSRYREKCAQLHLLRYQIPDDHSTIRTKGTSYHYHALRHSKTIAGSGMYFCPYCGKLLTYHNDRHKCPQQQRTLCLKCGRPLVNRDDFKNLSLSGQAECCLEESLNVDTPISPINCNRCNISCIDGSCFNVHVRRCKTEGRFCRKCGRYVLFKGIYKQGLEKFDGCHKDCSDIYCAHCDAYITHEFTESKNTYHTCFIKPVEKAPTWPRGVIAFDLETTPSGQANLVSAVFPKMIACPKGGVGLKVFADFSLDDYSSPYPPYQIPENSSLGEKYIQDSPHLGLPAMDLSHLTHLYDEFPYEALIHGKMSFPSTEEPDNIEDILNEHVDCEEADLINFPEDRGSNAKGTTQRAHPFNVHKLNNLQSDPSNVSTSYVNSVTYSLGRQCDLQKSASASEVENLSHDKPSTRRLANLLDTVDQEQDFVSMAYNLQPQVTEEEARQEDVSFNQTSAKKIPSQIKAFLDLEAEVSNSSSNSDPDAKSNESSVMSVTDEDENQLVDLESDSNSELIAPCQLSKNRVSTDSDTEGSNSETESVARNTFTISDTCKSGPSNPKQTAPVVEAEGKVLLSSIIGTISDPTPRAESPARYVSSPQNLTESVMQDTTKEACCWKCCQKADQENNTVMSLDNLAPHEEAFCSHCFSSPKPVTSDTNQALFHFLKWLNQEQFYSFICIAHYGSKFDLPIVLRAAIDLGYRVDLKTRGNKIMAFTIKGTSITFLDSYLFIPTSLRKMKDSFNLKSSSKGHFPFFLNQPKFYDLVMSHHPELNAYQVNLQSDSNQDSLKTWWESNKSKPFYMRQHLTDYCIDDTILLYEGVQVFINKVLQLEKQLDSHRASQKPLLGNGLRIRFPNRWIQLSINARQAFTENDRQKHYEKTGVWLPKHNITVKDLHPSQVSIHPANIYPLSKTIMTLSSLGYRIFRMFGISDPYTLPALRGDVAASVANQSSYIELEYLMFMKETTYPLLIFGYGRTHQAMFCHQGKRYYVDGYDPDSGTIIEFAGCSTHGCYICFSPHLENRFGVTNSDAYFIFQTRIEILESIEGVNKVLVKWGHEWLQDKAKNVRIKETVEQLDLSQANVPLNPRNAFRGGICGPSSLMMSRDVIAERLSMTSSQNIAPSDIKAVSIDVNSMYPSFLLPPEKTTCETMVDTVPIPSAIPICLTGEKCLEECDESCYERHQCIPGTCQHYCRFRRLQSQGQSVKETGPTKSGNPEEHHCSYQTCKMECFFDGRLNHDCARFDDHKCDDKNTCHKACIKHHPPNHYGRVPGCVSATLLPPKNVRFPVLRIELITATGEKRLVSPLCRTCAQEKHNFASYVQCDHSDDERMINGCFTLSEVSFAINKQNYKLVHVSATFFYPRYTQNLFHSLLEHLSRTKITSSGFPSKTCDKNEKRDYVRHVKKTSGFSDIQLYEITHDPALRNICKFLMNSIIGKTGQAPISSGRDVVTDLDELLKIQRDPRRKITWYQVLNEKVLLVFHQTTPELQSPFLSGQVLIAAEVTARSRQFLIKSLTQADEAGYTPLYTDTDSMILCSVVPNPPPLKDILPLNEVRLGAWKLELEGIVSFYSPGPKSYELTFEDKNGTLHYLLKCKGLSLAQTLIERANQKDAFKRLVLESLKPIKTHYESDDESSQNTISVSSTNPQLVVYQHRISIDPQTFLPKNIELFKQVNVIGPQSVLNIADHIEFNDQKVRQKTRKTLIDKPPQWENEYCQRFDNDMLVIQSDNSEVKRLRTEETIDTYEILNTSGLLPAYPFGFDLETSVNLPVEHLSLKP